MASTIWIVLLTEILCFLAGGAEAEGGVVVCEGLARGAGAGRVVVVCLEEGGAECILV